MSVMPMPLRGLLCLSLEESQHSLQDGDAEKKAKRAKAARDSYWRRKEADPDAFRALMRERKRAEKEKDPERFLEKKREAQRKLVAKDPDAYRKRQAEAAARRRKADPTKSNEANKRWREKNKDKVRASRLRRWRKYMEDPAKAFRARVSSLVRASLRRGSKSRSIEASLGYTVDELRAHIEKQFLPGMGWHNMADWHIDHIVPASSFDFESDTDNGFVMAWALTNLRPLWAKDNVKKGARNLYLV